ncbi:MAG TPA: 50S ribosomal protein L22 [Thermodesulfobacteriota bacterium]|nr:50S ribosomal protein L22 [Thermodesulfobacteriota bacterium]
MEARAVAKYIRVSPQKARLVIDLIRGKNVSDALGVLNLNTKAISRDISKVLKSALSNAENTKKMDVDRLYVKRAYVDQGPSSKRMQARAMGRGYTIIKRASHITIVLDERE